MIIKEEYVYKNDEGKLLTDFCDTCQKQIHQEEIEGEFVCEYCKSPSSITIVEVYK